MKIKKSVCACLADEDFPDQIVHSLRLLGHDVERVRGLCEDKAGDGLSDDIVLAEAIRLKRIILTYNVKDFRRLHHECQWHNGIIACSENRKEDPKVIAKRVDTILRQHGQHGMRGRFERLKRINPPVANHDSDPPS